MTPKQQAELDELNITAEQLASRTQEMERLAAGESQPINATLPLGAARIAGGNAMDAKQVVESVQQAARTRKTRSDAGKTRPVKTISTDYGTAQHQEIMDGMNLATKIASEIKAVPNRAVRHMIREMLAIMGKWDVA